MSFERQSTFSGWKKKECHRRGSLRDWKLETDWTDCCQSEKGVANVAGSTGGLKQLRAALG